MWCIITLRIIAAHCIVDVLDQVMHFMGGHNVDSDATKG